MLLLAGAAALWLFDPDDTFSQATCDRIHLGMSFSDVKGILGEEYDSVWIFDGSSRMSQTEVADILRGENLAPRFLSNSSDKVDLYWGGWQGGMGSRVFVTFNRSAKVVAKYFQQGERPSPWSRLSARLGW